MSEELPGKKITDGIHFEANSLENPAIFSNRFHFYCSDISRLSFAEVAGGKDPKYHTSIVMTKEGARLLAELILHTLDQVAQRETSKP